METIEEIVAEMRGRGEDSRVDRWLWKEYADRIEAVIRKNRTSQESRHVQAVTNCNQLKMREAVAETEKRIDKVISILTEIPDSCGYGGLLEDAADELCDLKEEFVKPALAAPPRNCDLYATEAEAYRGWERYYNSIDTKDGYLDFEDWLFAEAKGEAK